MFCLAGCTNNSSQAPSSETPSSTTVSVTGVTITSANNVRSIKEGETLQLTATVLPEGANQGVTWTSSSETNATVSNTGLVTAVKAGNVTITATSTADTTKSATFSLVIEKGEDPLPTAITVTAFGEEYAGMSPQDAVNACAEKYIASYREINLELAGAEAGAGASALSWDKYTEGMFTGTYGKKMTGYKVTDYSYTGGAHGMSSETCLVFNMKTGDRVSLDDIFRDDSRDILTSLLTRHAKDGKTENDTAVKDGNGTPAVQKAGSDDAETDNAGTGHVADYLLVTEVEPTENFTVDDEGVTFVYNPYEIAAYAAGTVRIMLPWDELEGLLK